MKWSLYLPSVRHTDEMVTVPTVCTPYRWNGHCTYRLYAIQMKWSLMVTVPTVCTPYRWNGFSDLTIRLPYHTAQVGTPTWACIFGTLGMGWSGQPSHPGFSLLFAVPNEWLNHQQWVYLQSQCSIMVHCCGIGVHTTQQWAIKLCFVNLGTPLKIHSTGDTLQLY